jgi:uncharacterized protein YbjQ (UPF0145 family)
MGEAILGAHVGRDIMASLTDIVGGRSAEYDADVDRASGDVDYEVIRQGMLMVAVSGTAVKVH